VLNPVGLRAGKMAQWLRALAALEDLVPRPTWQLTAVCSSSSRRSDMLDCSPWASDIRIYTGKSLIYIKVNKIFLKI
ncbi:hypothetical protein ACQP3F_33375, partial [Escherichia coli]